MKVDSIVLANEFVRLEPLITDHAAQLCEVGLEEDLWKLNPAPVDSPEAMAKYIEQALDEKARGVSLPFVIVDGRAGKIVGSTRFGNIDAKNRRAEIGWTWINPRWQQTYVNTAAKLLMLTHAFETWRCIRIELKTDALNRKSRAAILRLGAKEEGIFRQHMICDSGRLRDTVYFSILDNEWDEVKKNLLQKLGEI